MLSRGESKIRCTAMVSSTTPRFGPRWPPVWETLPIRNSLTSAASCSSCASDNLLRSCGLRMVSKIPNGPSLRVVDMPFNSNASEPGGMPETGKPRSVVDGPGLSGGAAGRPLASGDLAQHVLQDAAVAVVVGFTRGIDAQDRVEGGGAAVFGRRGDLEGLRRGALVQGGDALNGEGFRAGQPQAGGVLSGRVLQRQDAHADQVVAVDALVAFGDDSLDTQQGGTLGGPVTGRTGAVLLAGQDHQRGAGCLVVLRGVVDVGLRAVSLGEVAGEATLDAIQELVLDADVRERAADHHFVVATAGAVGVEVLALHAVGQQVLAGGGVGLEGTGRGDVVGGDGVAELQEHAGTRDVLDGLRLGFHALEVWGLPDVGGLLVPGKGVAGRG